LGAEAELQPNERINKLAIMALQFDVIFEYLDIDMRPVKARRIGKNLLLLAIIPSFFARSRLRGKLSELISYYQHHQHENFSSKLVYRL